MLSFNLNYGKTPPQDVDIKSYILKIGDNIKLKSERETVMSLVFSKTHHHKVKCMPFDYAWEINSEFESVCDALITLSYVCIAFSRFRFEDRNSHFIINHIKFLHGILKSGLMTMGCKSPPKNVALVDVSNLRKDTVLEIARQVNEEFVLDHPQSPAVW